MAEQLARKAERKGPPLLRFEFVGMLFALAVAEVAVKWSQLISEYGLYWKTLSAHTHLILAISLIAASWIGWSWSAAKGNVEQIEHPFSIGFVILLVDVALVILYFMVARSVELGGKPYPVPSAREELILVSVIFSVYLFWDFLTKALFASAPGELDWRNFWSRGRVSGACLLIALAVTFWLRDVKTPVGVCGVDVSLVGLTFLFRAWKREFWRSTWICAGVILVGGIAAYILG